MNRFNNPFDFDEQSDRMDLSTALQLVEDEINNLPYLENTMTEETKTPAKKVAAKKVAAKPAEAVKTEAPAKKVAAKPAEAVKTEAPAKKVAAKKAPVETKTKEPKANGPRSVPDGYVGLSALADELGMAPAALRRKLRGLENVQKPEGDFGWKWKEGSKDLAAVRKALAA